MARKEAGEPTKADFMRELAEIKRDLAETRAALTGLMHAFAEFQDTTMEILRAVNFAKVLDARKEYKREAAEEKKKMIAAHMRKY